jgi:hypothetical protein
MCFCGIGSYLAGVVNVFLGLQDKTQKRDACEFSSVALLLPFFWAAAVLGSDAGSADVHASQVSPVPDCS